MFLRQKNGTKNDHLFHTSWLLKYSGGCVGELILWGKKTSMACLLGSRLNGIFHR